MFDKHELKCASYASFVAIILNLVLSMFLKHFAREEEIISKNGLSKLSFKGQVMNILFYHSQEIGRAHV